MKLLTISQYAKKVGCSRQNIHTKVKRGTLDTKVVKLPDGTSQTYIHPKHYS